jgi:NADPH-dependent ferric siderophore reductase
MFAWAGTEAIAARALRTRWRSELGMTTEQSLATAYWRR